MPASRVRIPPSPSSESPAAGGAFAFTTERRGRDLNPRRTFQHVRDFQSRSLDHSDTSPSDAQRTAPPRPPRYHPPRRRGGRAVECGGLENRYPSLGGSRVQIPPPPLFSCPAFVRSATPRISTVSPVGVGLIANGNPPISWTGDPGARASPTQYDPVRLCNG